MNFRYLCLILFLLFCNTSFSQSKKKVKYDYLLYLPKEYKNNNKNYPLIIYLHGGSQKGNDLNKLKNYGLPHAIEKGKNFTFIIASPQCPDNKFWSTDNWFDSLYSELSNKYRIDKNRVYLTGISMGGYGTFITALDFPEKFAAIVPLCGGINDIDTLRVCNLKKTPIWAFHGTNDDKVSITETERILNKLKYCDEKNKFRFTRLNNVGHDIGYLYESKAEIYKWLVKQKLKK